MDQKLLQNITDKYILKYIFSNIQEKKIFQILQYNKNLQEKLELELKDYKKYFMKIEIELYPIFTLFNKFINIKTKNNASLINIYFNEDYTKEIKRTYLLKEEKDSVKKIKINIDGKFTDFKGLFQNIECIEKIIFIKFKRDDITDMSYLFSGCTSLKEIYFNSFNTSNVIYMNSMFSYCYNLNKIIFKNNNFVTNNVNNMDFMFYKCLDLKEIENPKFNLSKVRTRTLMLNDCPLNFNDIIDI